MSDKEDFDKAEIEKVFDRMERDGVAVKNVTDGHVLFFKVSVLKKLLEDYKDRKEFVVFVKAPEVN